MSSRRTTAVLLASLVSAAGSAEAEKSVGVNEQAAIPLGLGIGGSVGTSSQLRLKVRAPKIPLAVEIGYGANLWQDTGHQGTLLVSWEHSVASVRVCTGLGARLLSHRFDPESLDELGEDRHVGAHAQLAIGMPIGSSNLEVFGEVMPGLDFAKTESCSLLSGVNSVCPHQDDGRFYLNVGIGARYWFKQ